ncbi:MAG: contractile injection system tape measure protein [Desulfopila sp.]
MHQTTHQIGRQYLHLELRGSQQQGLALQRDMAACCHLRLSPAIEAVLQRYAPAEGHLLIDRLEIDAGTIALADLDRELPGRVARELGSWLAEHEAGTEGALPAPAGGPDKIRYRTSLQMLWQAFLFFVENGSLPWSFRLVQGQGLEHRVGEFLAQAAAGGGTFSSMKADLHQVLQSGPAARRLVLQFSENFLGQLLALFSPTAAEELGRLLAIIAEWSGPAATEKKRLSERLWQAALILATAAREIDGKTLIVTAFPGSLSAGRASPGQRRGQLPPETAASRLAAEIFAATARGQDGPSARRDRGLATGGKLPAARGGEAGAVLGGGGPVWQEPQNQWSIEDRGDREGLQADHRHHPEAGEGLYTASAGLVLLHPFLPQFFTAVHIVKEERIVRFERALCLLHFLATGSEVAPEHELILAKILCGLPLLTPVQREVGLTELEKEEAEGLLQAVIGHWQALRSTSADGLRQAFLRRPGKLSRRENGDWLLQVESMTVDILLEQLPWGLTMIQLPWMRSMLWVEWR